MTYQNRYVPSISRRAPSRLFRIPGVYLGALGRNSNDDDVEDEDTTVEDPRERRGGATLHFDSASDSRKGILIRHVVDVSPAVQASADRALSVADKAVEAATKATSSFSLAPIVFAGVGGLVVGALLAAAWGRASYRPRRIEPRE